MIQRICKLLNAKDPEVQCAAATVLGELKPKEKEVRSALEQSLKSNNIMVRMYALRAIEKLGVDGSLKKLVPLLGDAEQIRERVQLLFVESGARGEKILLDKLETAKPHIRKGILDVLGQRGGSVDTFLQSMLDEEFVVVRQASDSLIEKVKDMKDRAPVAKKVLAFLKSPKVKKRPDAIVGGIKVLGYCDASGAVPTLLTLVGPKQEKKVRTHALNALLHIDPGKKSADVAKKLIPFLEDTDPEITDRSLRVLQKLAPPADQTDRLIKLLNGRPPQIRLFATRALGQLGSQKAAKALLEMLFSEDQQIAGSAARGLRENPKFSDFLVKELGKTKDPKRAWKYTNIIKSYGHNLKKPVVRQFMQKLVGLVRKRDAGLQFYFEILRTAAPEPLHDTLLKEGRALLKKKNFEDAEQFLRLLDRNDLESDDSILSLAVSRLATLRKDLGNAHRDQSHAVSLFLRLARKDKFALAKRLEKETALKAEDLLYLGFCLTERAGVERAAGGRILKYVAKKYAKKNEGKIAKKKLSTQGL